MKLLRVKQVFVYAAIHSKQIQKEENKNFLYRIAIYYDMLLSFFRYRMWTNQYLKEKFHQQTKGEKKKIGTNYLKQGIKRDVWQRDFVLNNKFLHKYAQRKYDLSGMRDKRNKAYSKQYNMGKNCFVGFNVEISRQHYLDGTISIGNNVALAKNVFIDYSGGVEIRDNVAIADGVKIFTHGHDYFGSREDVSPNNKYAFKTKLVIGDNVNIGSNAMILSGVHEIGENSIISAGSVVTTKVPSNVIMRGNPARVSGKFPEGFKRTRSNIF